MPTEWTVNEEQSAEKKSGKLGKQARCPRSRLHSADAGQSGRGVVATGCRNECETVDVLLASKATKYQRSNCSAEGVWARHDTTRHDRAVHNGHGRIVLVLRVRNGRRKRLGSNGSDKQQASWQGANGGRLAAAMMAGPGEKVVLVG